jgi:hypothetical protein
MDCKRALKLVQRIEEVDNKPVGDAFVFLGHTKDAIVYTNAPDRWRHVVVTPVSHIVCRAALTESEAVRIIKVLQEAGV